MMALVLRRDPSFGITGIDVKATGETIAQYWLRAKIRNHLGRGGKGVGGHQHFVTAFQPNGIQRQL